MSPTADSARHASDSDPILAARDEVEEAGVTPADAATSAAQPGEVIDRYKLLQLIGEGGFGTVWMAEQREPVKRKVALKIIKLGMDTKQVVARFEAERQALAIMDHENIARVLDAGATRTGRPFFVMELVRGVPITEYCDTENASTEERLDLFKHVCMAVQHAHQKGIIHRDIKPSNVLVTMHDGRPVPKVIDFGIAKATNAELTEKTLFTEYRQFIGTPEYMSPEQAEMSGLDIDSRSDIYSLGVLLYELLTGTTPLERSRFLHIALGEIQRMIRDEEPQKPSTRLSSLTVTGEGPGIARHRRTDAATLTRELRGDIDWIVMKALEKDRTRRYATAIELARDIERHLTHEPIEASPPSRVYRLRKFARRNRAGVLAGCGVFATLIVGLLLATYGMIEAKEARAAAEEEARSTRAVAAFYADMFESRNPMSGAPGPVAYSEMTVEELLRQAAPRIATEFEGRPALEGAVRATFGRTFGGLGLFRESVDQLRVAVDRNREAFGGEHPDVVETLRRLSWALGHIGRGEEAAQVARETVELSSRVYGPDHRVTIESQAFLAFRLFFLGELEEAEPMAREAVARARAVLGNEAEETLRTETYLGMILVLRGRGQEAHELLARVRRLARRVFPEDSVGFLFPSMMLTRALEVLGRYDEALALLDETLEGYSRAFGTNHRWGSELMAIRGDILAGRGDFDEALAILRPVHEAQRELLGDDAPRTGATRNNLVPPLIGAGHLDEAEELARRSLEYVDADIAQGHWASLRTRFQLAWVRFEQGHLEEAEPVLAEVVREGDRIFPGGALPLPNVRMIHGRCLAALGRSVEAERALARALETMTKMHGREHPNVLECKGYLAEVRAASSDD